MLRIGSFSTASMTAGSAGGLDREKSYNDFHNTPDLWGTKKEAKLLNSQTWRRKVPGGAAGLQNQSGGRKVPGGFDSLPSPPNICFFNLTESYPTRDNQNSSRTVWLVFMVQSGSYGNTIETNRDLKLRSY